METLAPLNKYLLLASLRAQHVGKSVHPRTKGEDPVFWAVNNYSLG